LEQEYKYIKKTNDIILEYILNKNTKFVNKTNQDIIWKGHKIAKDIIETYFGGYIPDNLSDEGMECETEDDIYKLVEKMEMYYMDQQEHESFDESDIDDIHNDIIKWVRKHNN
jgi:hypothetical protein